ncbi:hypothetical protein CASFOL_023794 [Castilleja foliolosa]|uniref:Uncharacterized protein n=1 Tax=Castilleja foliolosa TaxID=1961234 RepID=A0ABD3CLI0_9LAMI
MAVYGESWQPLLLDDSLDRGHGRCLLGETVLWLSDAGFLRRRPRVVGLPSRPTNSLTDMELDECEETMCRKQQAAHEVYEGGDAQRV